MPTSPSWPRLGSTGEEPVMPKQSHQDDPGRAFPPLDDLRAARGVSGVPRGVWEGAVGDRVQFRSVISLGRPGRGEGGLLVGVRSSGEDPWDS